MLYLSLSLYLRKIVVALLYIFTSNVWEFQFLPSFVNTCYYLCFCFFNFFKCLFIFERQGEAEGKQGRGREREGDTESEAGSRFWAITTEPDAGLELMNCDSITWPEVRCSTDWATQAPCFSHPSGYEVVSYVVLICISLITRDVKYLFHVQFGNSYIFFGEMSNPKYLPI